MPENPNSKQMRWTEEKKKKQIENKQHENAQS